MTLYNSFSKKPVVRNTNKYFFLMKQMLVNGLEISLICLRRSSDLIYIPSLLYITTSVIDPFPRICCILT